MAQPNSMIGMLQPSSLHYITHYCLHDLLRSVFFYSSPTFIQLVDVCCYEVDWLRNRFGEHHSNCVLIQQCVVLSAAKARMELEVLRRRNAVFNIIYRRTLATYKYYITVPIRWFLEINLLCWVSW